MGISHSPSIHEDDPLGNQGGTKQNTKKPGIGQNQSPSDSTNQDPSPIYESTTQTKNPNQVTHPTPRSSSTTNPNQVTPPTPRSSSTTNPNQVTLPTPRSSSTTNPNQVTLPTPRSSSTTNPNQVTLPTPRSSSTTNPNQVTLPTPRSSSTTNPNQVTSPSPRSSLTTTTPKPEKVVRKCTERYQKKYTTQQIGDLSKNLSNPAWIAEELFTNDENITLKLLLVPVTPSIFAQVTKITGSSYGYLHTALQFNNKVVDWDQSGLIVPRPFSSTVQTALDIVSADTHKFQITPEMVQKVSIFIAEWNNNYDYNRLTRNCQHFVNQFVEQLGIKLEWNETIASYLNEIKKNPENVSPHICYEKDGKKVKVVFNSHEELDKFCDELKITDPDQYSSLQKLLKAFDRGFWFRDRAKNPKTYEIPKTCPFNLPTAYREEDFQLELL